MDIIKFEYIYSEYATTNPPRSQCTAYALENLTDSSAELIYYTSTNGVEREERYTLSNSEFGEIYAIINSGVAEEIVRQTPTERNPQFMQMCGGNVTSGVNLILKSGKELQTKAIPPASQTLINLLYSIVNKRKEQ